MRGIWCSLSDNWCSRNLNRRRRRRRPRLPRLRDLEVCEGICKWEKLVLHVWIFGSAFIALEVGDVEGVGGNARFAHGYLGGEFGEHLGCLMV